MRSTWLPAANLVVLGWLVATALSVAGGGPAWLAVHMFLLGAVSSAILVWSEHFAVAVLHAREVARREAALRLAALNAGTVAVVVGRLAGWPLLLAAGALITVAAVASHALMLWRLRRRGLGGVLAGLVRYYLLACAALVAGGAIGALLGNGVGGEAWHARLLVAHLHLNLLGWVMLTVLGTLFMLWPVLLRTGMAPSTRWALIWCLRLAGGGLGVAVVGILLELRVVAAAGLAAYVAGVVVAARPMLAEVRGQRPRSGAGWMVGAAVCWLAGAVAADAVVLAVSPDPGALPDRLSALGPVLLIGVVGQVLIGSLAHLLPVAIGGGPAVVRASASTLELGWPVRVLAVNAAVLLVSLPVLPGYAHTVGWLLVGLSVIDVVVRSAWLIVARSAEGSGPRRSLPAVVGSVAGAMVIAIGLTFAGSGEPSDGVLVSGGGVQEVEVQLSGMRIRPALLTVTPGVQLRLRVVNEDSQPHDLRLANGQRTAVLRRGQRATLDVGTVTGDLAGWCTVAGHRAAGMTMRIQVGGDATSRRGPAADPPPSGHPGAAHGHDMSAPYGPGFMPYPAGLAPPDTATLHRLDLRVVERDLEVTPGHWQKVWTFGGTVPGPTLRGRVGDVFEVTLINDGTLGHGVDFHAGALAPDEVMRTLHPGERLVYRFQATRAGAWLYHCSTAPLLQHVGNGMFGAVIIDPPALPTVDREYVLVASELYLGEPGSEEQVAAMRAGTPDAWVFNGAANGYLAAPLPARVGERVRIWVVAAGPASGVAFHVVGAQFDTVYKEGAWTLRPGPDADGAQVLDLAAAQGGFVELTFPEPGRYPFVDHDLRHADSGAVGVFAVTG